MSYWFVNLWRLIKWYDRHTRPDFRRVFLVDVLGMEGTLRVCKMLAVFAALYAGSLWLHMQAAGVAVGMALGTPKYLFIPSASRDVGLE